MEAASGGTAGTAGPQSPAFGSVSNAIVTVVYGGRPFAHSLKRAWVPLGNGVTDPSRLLRARAAVVPYLDPAGHMDALRGWLTGPEPFSVRVVGGRGGSGKTRLAVELCRAADGEGWAAGLLGTFGPESVPTKQATGGSEAGPRAPGMLVVIDYAETRTSELDALLPALLEAADPARRTRVLLLVRRAPRGTDWTDGLRTGDDELDAILDTAAPHQIILEETAWTFDDRQNLYHRSWKAFAQRSENPDGTSPGAAPPPPDLTAESFGNPLLVAATAYLAARDPGRTLPDTREGLLEGILNHEASHWARADRPEDPDGTVTRRATAMAALAGADTEIEGAALLRHIPDLEEATSGVRMAWTRWYQRFYPGPRFWNPLEPDLLGEHLIATTLTEFPAILSAAVDPGRGPNTAQPLIVIARIAATSQTMNAYAGFNVAAVHALQDILPLLTRAAVEEALIPPTDLPAGPTIAPALTQTVNTLSPHLGTVIEALAMLPERSLPHVNTLAAALCRHQVSWLRSRPDPSTSVAGILAENLNALSIALGRIGDREGALEAVRESVDIRRVLAKADPVTYSPELAASLNNLSNRLTDTGDHDGALDAIHEATTLYQGLADFNPVAYTHVLAVILNNLSSCLAGAGDRTAALEAIRGSADIRRVLAKADPVTYSPELAASLNNLSNRLADMGDRDGSLDAIHEATLLYRGLADANPAAYTHLLALALNNLSICLADAGDHDKALNTIREAVDVRRALANAHPAAYIPDLATSLNNLSNSLADSGNRDGALDAIHEATLLYRGLADANPAAYVPDLAASLNNLSNRLADAGHHDRALNTIREAVNIRRALANAHPAAYTPYLAGSLSNLSRRLADTGNRDGALQTIQESTVLYRGLADAHPAAYIPDLARTLRMQAALLDKLGQRARATSARDEADRLSGAGP